MSANEVFDLATDLGRASAAVAVTLHTAYKAEGEAFANDWRANATATSGKHGKHYPSSITSETKIALGIHVATGPESSKPQGGMGRGFEFGSRNQPPHLDGARALPAAMARLAATTEAALGNILR